MDELAARLLADYEAAKGDGPELRIVQIAGPIPRGGVVVFSGMTPPPGENGADMMVTLMGALAAVTGHDEFTVILTELDGDVTVVDLRADAREVIRRLTLDGYHDGHPTPEAQPPWSSHSSAT